MSEMTQEFEKLVNDFEAALRDTFAGAVNDAAFGRLNSARAALISAYEAKGEQLAALMEALEIENRDLLLTKPPDYFHAIGILIAQAAKRGAKGGNK